MSAPELTSPDSETEQPSRRVRPTEIVIGLGVAFAILTLVSGISSALRTEAPPPDISRPVFDGVPNVLRLVFYIVVPLLIVYGAVQFSRRTRNWERGKPDNRTTTAKNAQRRLGDFRAGVYMQTLLRDPAAGVM